MNNLKLEFLLLIWYDIPSTLFGEFHMHAGTWAKQKDLLFRATHYFTFFKYDFPNIPRFQGDPGPQTGFVQWSQHGEAWFVYATSYREAKGKMREFIIANPEKFTFWSNIVYKCTHEELAAYFRRALDNKPQHDEPPRINQHRIEVELIEKIIR